MYGYYLMFYIRLIVSSKIYVKNSSNQYLLLCFMFLLFAFFCNSSNSSLALANEARLDQIATELITKLVLNGSITLSEELVLYQRDKDLELFLPMDEILKKLGIAASITDQKVQGYVGDKNQSFTIDLTTLSATSYLLNSAIGKHKNKTSIFNISQSDFYWWQKTLYVHQKVLEKILPLLFEFHSHDLELQLMAPENIPVLLSQKRAQEFSNLMNKKWDPYAQYRTSQYSIGDFPPILENIFSAKNSKSEDTHDTLLDYQGQFMSRTHHFLWEANGEANNKTAPVGNMSVSTRRGDFEYKWGNIFLQGSSLVLAPQQVLGFSASSRDAQFDAGQYTVKNFSGKLLPGWEVELYYNGVMIDRQKEQQGKYFFANIPLNFGSNVFTFKAFGPFGEYSEWEENYTIDDAFLRGKKNSLHLETSLEGAGKKTLLEYTDLWANYWAITPGVVLDGGQNYFPYLKNSFFLNHLVFNFQVATDKLQNFATETSMTAFLWNQQFSLTHYGIKDYDSPWVQTTQRQDVRQEWNALWHHQFNFFIPVQHSINYQDQLHLNAIRDAEKWTETLTAFTAWFSLSHEITWNTSDHTYGGDIAISHDFSLHNLRLQTHHQQYHFEEYSLIDAMRWQDDMTSSAQLNFFPRTDAISVALGGTKRLSDFDLSLQMDSDFNKNYSLSTNVHFSWYKNIPENKWQASSKSLIHTYQVQVRSFLDLNENNVFDSDETFAGPVLIKTSKGESITLQNSPVLIQGVQSDEKIYLTYSSELIKNPSWIVAVPGDSIDAMSSEIVHVDIPIIYNYEVEGKLLCQDDLPESERKKYFYVKLQNLASGKIWNLELDDDAALYQDHLSQGHYQLTLWHRLGQGAAEEVIAFKDFSLSPDQPFSDFLTWSLEHCRF